MPKIYKSRNIVVQSPRHVQLFVTPWTVACQAFLSLTISWSLPKFMSIASAMPSIHLILWNPLLLLPLIFPSIRDFSNKSAAHIRWPKYWSFSFSSSPSNKYSGLISLKIDWFDLRAVHGTQDSSLALQFKGISSLAFCLLYGPALTTPHDHWKTTASTVWTFVGTAMSLLLNTLSTFVIAFLPRSNRLLILWLQSPSSVILEPTKRKSLTTSTFSPTICHEVKGLDAMILVFLIFNLKLGFSLSSFTLIKRFFSSSLLCAIKSGIICLSEVSCFSCLSWFQLVTHPAWHFSWCAQGDSWQPSHTPFSVLNQSVVPYRVLTVASWPTLRFLRKQVFPSL